MTNEKKTEIKVGATTLFAIILFLLIFGWAKNFSLNSNEKYLTVKFPTAAGLEIGDLVAVNGVRKGIVNNIATEANGALIKIKFNEPVNLKEDATFNIMMLDLMGGKKIAIDAGNAANELDFTKVQKGNFAGDVATSMAMLSSVQNDLVDVIKEVKVTLKSINKFISDSTFAENISASVKSAKDLTHNLNELIEENKILLTETIENIKQLTNNVNGFIDSNKTEMQSAVKNLNATLKASEKLITKLNKLSDEITDKENNIGKIIYDEKLVSDLKTSFSEIKKLVKTLNEQLDKEGLKVKADVDLF